MKIWVILSIGKKGIKKAKAFSGILQAGVSGGGSLPSHVDRFFEVSLLDILR